MSSFLNELKNQLTDLRHQGMQISDINPVSALADMMSDKLYNSQINMDDIDKLIAEISSGIWDNQAARLAQQTSLEHADDARTQAAARLLEQPFDRAVYRAVFTAHPVFALQHENSLALCESAMKIAAGGKSQMPPSAYEPRAGVSLQDEHAEAMKAQHNARRTISNIYDEMLQQKAKKHPQNWKDELPLMVGVSTWVGYDLDGRSDITWLDTLILRVTEKIMALDVYHKALSAFSLPDVQAIAQAIAQEIDACQQNLDSLEALKDAQNASGDASADDLGDGFADAFDAFTQRENKLIGSRKVADDIHQIAKDIDEADDARALMLIAADIATHGFGMGEIHLRINAVQLRNAMRSIDGRSLSTSDGSASSRILMERLAKRIETEAPWQINFSVIDQEATTARRQLMLAAQFIKHIDADQPIRLLIAECERPITYMSALYLAHKLDVANMIDISPLFETSFGLENGANMMAQLFEFEVIQNYIRTRQRVAIQLGFSDAGRFMGQLAANLAIERLQIKILDLCAESFGNEIELLLFNTHGESLGRGCARPTLEDRQNFILTPFVKSRALGLGTHIYHQSSFQGGDGYRLFGTQTLSDATLAHIILAETQTPSEEWQNDPVYQQHDFALDLFLSLKQWHENLFASPDYGLTLDVFGANLLPKTGSRPAKRVVQAGNERRDPSKIRAIPHNALLQQLGFLAIVVSGIGSAAHIDSDRFADIFTSSPRLKQLVAHVNNAKRMGSLNTMLAYARLLDNGFWIGRAYHGNQHDNQRAFRLLASHLDRAPFAGAMRQTAWKLRDDLVYLYRLFNKIEMGNIRTSGTERIELDILHAIRLSIITDSLIKVASVPRFAESNKYSNTDLVNAALRLDFELVCQIIEVEFPEKKLAKQSQLAEEETYLKSQATGYQKTRDGLLSPLYENQKRMRLVTQLISASYGAHG